MKFCVVGGMNLDVIASCGEIFRPQDSNPGKIRFGAGGVGSNIARALARAGHRVSLVTALSGDLFGTFLADRCREEGIDLSASIRTGVASSCYAALHGPGGDLVAAVNDMAAMESLTPVAIRDRAGFINSFDAAVTEANLSTEALSALAETAKCPLVADAVSVSKCLRLQPVLPYLRALKVNLAEARALSGEDGPRDAGRALLRRGVKCVLVSLGRDGVYACDEKEDVFIRPERTFDCQTNGAGDAMCAGLAEAACLGLGALQSAEMAQKAALKLLRARSE